MNQRLLYPDIGKFIAIFLVTWSHCSQCVSSEVWNNFLGGRHLDIAFNMPLFMLMSGWFINLDKMRTDTIWNFVSAKFQRLIIPSIVWYLVHQLILLRWPDSSFLTYYWYLNALFVCLCFIMLTSKVIKNNILCCLVSTIIVLITPNSDASHINFMMPFLWAGYGLRRVFQTRYTGHVAACCAIMAFILCLFWKPAYTDYLSPFNSLYISRKMIMVYGYRFMIGFTISSVIIYILMKTENSAIKRLAPLGKYSLVIYTSSAILLVLLMKFLDFINFHTNAYLLIDIVSLLFCVIIVILAVLIGKLCKYNEILSRLFLGEKGCTKSHL